MTGLALLHGLGGSAADWSDVLARVPEPAVVLDAPGHGGRRFSTTDDFVTMAGEVVDALDRRSIDRAVLVGASMGAATAVTVAAVAPERVAGLLLLAPAWWRDAEPPNLRRLQKIGAIIERRGLDAAWEVVSSVPPLSWYDPATRARYRQRFLAADRGSLAMAMQALPRRLPLWPQLPDRWLGTRRVVTWREDPIHPVDVAVGVAGELDVEAVALDRPRSRPDEVTLVADLIAQSLDLDCHGPPARCEEQRS